MRARHMTNTLVAERRSGNRSGSMGHRMRLSTPTHAKEVMVAGNTVHILGRCDTMKKKSIAPNTGS